MEEKIQGYIGQELIVFREKIADFIVEKLASVVDSPLGITLVFEDGSLIHSSDIRRIHHKDKDGMVIYEREKKAVPRPVLSE